MHTTCSTKRLSALTPMAEASDNQRMAPARVDGGRDRISALPDNVLLRIMSPLDARHAVQTCILSRRWRHLWRSVPRINVSVEEFEGMAANRLEDEALFKKFVNRLLMLRNPVGLDEFRLTYRVTLGTKDMVAGSADANLWIGHALNCRAQVVEVDNQDLQLQLVPAVFTSQYLKRLHISCADLIVGFFERLESGCPVLEHLHLSDLTIMDPEISSQTLKVLILNEVQFDDRYRASISAPKLISLCFHNPEGARLPLIQNMASLETASVSLRELFLIDFDADDLRQFLMSLSDVRNLDFNYRERKLTVEKNYPWCPKFKYLINLTLHKWCLRADYYALIVFLQNSPSLKKLSLRLNKPQQLPLEFSEIIGELEERLFTCVQLEIVDIICSEDNPLLSSVKQFLLDSGIPSGQIHINHQN